MRALARRRNALTQFSDLGHFGRYPRKTPYVSLGINCYQSGVNMKTVRLSGSLKFSALSLLAAVSVTGNPVTAAESGSDAQRQAAELLSGTPRDVTDHLVRVTAVAVSPTFGDAQSQARGLLAPDAAGRHRASTATTAWAVKGPTADRLARNQPDAQEAARYLLGGQAVLN